MKSPFVYLAIDKRKAKKRTSKLRKAEREQPEGERRSVRIRLNTSRSFALNRGIPVGCNGVADVILLKYWKAILMKAEGASLL